MRLSRAIAVVAIATAHVCAQASKPGLKQTPCVLAGQVLRCSHFGFSYKVPFGWVDRTAEMQQESQPRLQASPDASSSANLETKLGEPRSENSEILLSAFERPPGAPGDTINSAVVIAAEPLANYHGVKSAADYFGAIRELVEQGEFKAVSDPYEFSVGTKRLVRGDFTKERGKLTMYQTSLAMMDSSYFVSFTFIGGSEDEIDELIGNLNFALHARQSATQHH